MIRVLGIDPGTRCTGVGVIDCEQGQAHCVHYRVIRTKGPEFSHRLGEIFRGLGDALERFQPELVAIEKVFVNSNAESSLKLGAARGAAICAVIHHGLDISEYAPNAVKKALVGRGHADKAQVEHMVKVLLNLHGKIPSDAADALAIALCHQHHTETAQRLQKAASWGS